MRILLPLAGGLLAWWLVYRNLAAFSAWLTYQVLPLEKGSHLAAALEFFIFETPKVLMLLTLVVFAVGIIRTFFTPERTRRILAGKSEFVGNILAALLGIVTPFCSCSAVPLFIGFVTTGVPLGVTFSFLISAPMVNEVALVLLFGLFGWKVAGLYLATGLVVAMVAGWVMGRLKMEKHVEEWVFQIPGGVDATTDELDWPGRIRAGWDAVKDIVGRVWIYVLLGIAVGAGIHGYVPENFMASLMGTGRVVGGAAGGVARRADVFERRRNHPGRAGPARQGRGARHGAGLHDVGHRPFPAGGHHFEKSPQATAHRHLFRRGGDRHPARRLFVQRDPLIGISRQTPGQRE